MKKNKQICYRCGGLAPTIEHVPPKCLFPEKKDAFGVDMRSNLVTVPSCHLHNTKKSNDDEYLMICLAGSVKGNSIGYFHFNTKVKRTVLRSHRDFLERLIREGEIHDYTNAKGIIVPGLKTTVQLKRLHNSLKNIFYGIYYYEAKEVFTGSIKIMENFSDKSSDFDQKMLQVVSLAYENDSKLHPPKGSNPEIFQYQFTNPDQFGLIGCKLTFYGGLDVYGAFMPNYVKIPSNLAIESIKKGNKTIIAFGDKTVEFN